VPLALLAAAYVALVAIAIVAALAIRRRRTG